MRILFVTQFAAHFHYFKSIIRALCTKGYDVKLLIIKHPKYNKPQYLEAIESFTKEFDNFKYAGAKLRKSNVSAKILFLTRDLLNYRQYYFFDNQSSYYQDRLLRFFPPFVTFIIHLPIVKDIFRSNFFGNVLRSIEKNYKPVPDIISDIKDYNPQIILAAPVNMRRSHFASDLEYLKAAQYLNIPSAIPVISWDNLTTKGLFHIMPNLFFVWNEVQREEAKKIHGIPESSTCITGSPLFDGWFGDLKPSQSREQFCKIYGLDPQKKILLYLGSSSNMSKDESWIALRMREELNREGLEGVQIAIRPHPSNYRIYEKIISPGIILVPKEGILPNRPEELQLFYDSLYYSFAVVDGVNTSGIIDATIMDKPGLIVFTKEHEKTQLETQHFRQLIEGDVLYGMQKFDEFSQVVKKLLAGGDTKKENRRRFVEKFIRPLGIEKNAGDVIADEVRKIIDSSFAASS